MHNPSDKDRFVDLLSDWAFKFIFWNTDNKDLLIHLINTLLKGKTVIKDLRQMNVEKPSKIEDGRGSTLDLYCTTDTDEHIVIEIQRSTDSGFVP
ncbi:MAG: PD-(D/E)XK nuclease family transposase, partial [Cyanobacteria bacterium P01_H01_bin.74]